MAQLFKRILNKLFLALYLFLIIPSAKAGDSGINKIAIGIWRGEILRADGHAIPFIFQTRITSGKLVIYVVNGTERILVDNIRQQDDSVFIDMPFFDSHFNLRILNSEKMEGSWIKNYGDRQTRVPFIATFDIDERYPSPHPPAFDISGRWSVHFKGAKDSTESVGEFLQSGSSVRGTFLTTTGDYRYLDGVVSGDTLKLSTFDGGHAYSFVSIIPDANRMTNGFFYSAATSIETWTAEKNEKASLPDEFSLTRLRDTSNAKLHFKFPDLNNKMVSLSDSAFRNKVVIVQILGSWCPNCMDETRFLSSYYIQNQSRGVEIVGLAYERTSSPADAKRLLQPFVFRFHVTYPILLSGVAVSDSLRTEKTLPEIQQIIGFPTTIFIDRKGIVRKIHTGFNGPGTGAHYEIYKKEFGELVNQLLSE